MKLFDNSSFISVHKALDAAALRQQVISNNIANATTPGFKKSTVKFEEYLTNAIGSRGISGIRTDSRHIPIGTSTDFQNVQARVILHQDTKINNNENNVDIVAENANLAKNQILYDALAQNMNGKFSKIKTIIGGK